MGSDIKGYFTSPKSTMLDVDTLSSQLATIMMFLGYACAVIMILYIGIRYTIARPAEKAQLKTQLTYLALGSILLICGTTVLGVVGGAFANVFGATGW